MPKGSMMKTVDATTTLKNAEYRVISVSATFHPFHIPTSLHTMSKDIPKVAEVVRHGMPEAPKKLEEATVNLRNYLAVIYRIFLRLEAEGKLPEIFAEDPKSD